MGQRVLVKTGAPNYADAIPGGSLYARLKKQEVASIKHRARKDDLTENVKLKTEEIEALTDLSELSIKANILLKHASQYKRDAVISQIEDIGTFALRFVLGDSMALKIESKDATSGTSVAQAEFYVVETLSDGTEVARTPEDNYAGGVVDIISTALRLAIIQIHEPGIDGPILLDEPGKHVSAEYVEKFCLFLKEMGRQFGRQIILITHNPTLADAADNVIYVSREDGAPSEVLCMAR